MKMLTQLKPLNRLMALTLAVSLSLASTGVAADKHKAYQADDDILIQINAAQNAYASRDAENYRATVYDMIEASRDKSLQELQDNLDIVVTEGIAEGFDGLEPFLMTHLDALAGYSTEVEGLVATRSKLAKDLWYHSVPAANVSQAIGKLDSRMVKSVRGEAARVLVDLSVDSTTDGKGSRTDDLINSEKGQKELCEVELRVDDLGKLAADDLRRERLCQEIDKGMEGTGWNGLLSLRPFTDLSCFAQNPDTQSSLEVADLTRQCFEDSLPGQEKSVAWGDKNGDGVWGNPEKHNNGQYPYQRYLSLFKGSYDPSKTRNGEKAAQVGTFINDMMEREADEEALSNDPAYLEGLAEEAEAAVESAEGELQDAIDNNYKVQTSNKSTDEQKQAAAQAVVDAEKKLTEARTKANEARAHAEQAKEKAKAEQSGASNPAEPGQINMNSQACMDLMMLGKEQETSIEELYEAIYDPVTYPSPEAEPSEEFDTCGLGEQDPTTKGAQCENLVVCDKGFTLTDSCNCTPDELTAEQMNAFDRMLCPMVYDCEGNTTVDENGMCVCDMPQDEGGSLEPRTPIDLPNIQ